MADQVNPLGSLTAGIAQALQVGAKPSSAPEKASPTKASNFQPKGTEEGPVDVSTKNIDAAAEKVKAYLQESQTDLNLSVDKDTERVVYKIINSATHEVIRQMPSEEVLAMARKLRKLSDTQNASGVLMDKEG